MEGDESPLPDDMDAAAMARAMGFSSFGGADRPAKKRRFHAADNAVIAAGPSSAVAAGTGANAVAVTVRPAAAASAGLPPSSDAVRRSITGESVRDGANGARPAGASNAGRKEEDADEDDDEDGSREDEGGDGAGDDDDDPAPQHLDTSRPSAPLPGGLPDLQLPARPPGVPAPGFGAAAGGSHPGQPRGGGRGGGRGSGGGSRGGYGGNRGGRGEGSQAAPWWTDYYDPSSNENPWERLEQSRGLEAKGSWLQRGG